ncbi:MAG: hypothetical protein KAT05_10175, partial [Spirochaetes bacterium]|nr:hypothetical protein [Spirochaetota bacterium]
EKSNNIEKNYSLVEEFLLTVEIIESDIDILKKFGELKSKLSRVYNLIADADIFIGATALIKCNKLITGNMNHFNRIEGLRLENWIR